MPKLFSSIFALAALIALSGCDGCQTSTDEEGAQTGLVCADEEIEKVWDAIATHPDAETPFRAVIGLLYGCQGLDDDFSELAEELEAVDSVFRNLAASQMVALQTDLWRQVCPAGPRVFEKLETASATERFSILWDGCSLDERIPVSDDEVIINPPLADALLFLLIVGADGGRVEPQGRMADLARLIFASEMPNTPFDEADDASITLEAGELPGELGGVTPSAAMDSKYDAWPARLASLGGIVTPRLNDDGDVVESVEFCPFSPFDDPERLVTHLDDVFGNQVKRRVGDGPDVARIYRQNDHSLAVTYKSRRDGRKNDACLRLE